MPTFQRNIHLQACKQECQEMDGLHRVRCIRPGRLLSVLRGQRGRLDQEEVLCLERTFNHSCRVWIRGFHDLLRENPSSLVIQAAAWCVTSLMVLSIYWDLLARILMSYRGECRCCVNHSLLIRMVKMDMGMVLHHPISNKTASFSDVKLVSQAGDAANDWCFKS